MEEEKLVRNKSLHVDFREDYEDINAIPEREGLGNILYWICCAPCILCANGKPTTGCAACCTCLVCSEIPCGAAACNYFIWHPSSKNFIDLGSEFSPQVMTR